MNIFFVVNIYDEPESMVVPKVQKILDTYKTSEVCAIFDGGPSIEWAGSLPDSPRVTHNVLEHRKVLPHPGRWTQDYLEAFLASDKPTCIKFDPDTYVGPHLSYLPQQPRCLFGYTCRGLFLHGGCVGFSRVAAEEIVNSQLLVSGDIPPSGEYNDPLVNLIRMRLKIPMYSHSDILCASKVVNTTKSFCHK